MWLDPDTYYQNNDAELRWLLIAQGLIAPGIPTTYHAYSSWTDRMKYHPSVLFSPSPERTFAGNDLQ